MTAVVQVSAMIERMGANIIQAVILWGASFGWRDRHRRRPCGRAGECAARELQRLLARLPAIALGARGAFEYDAVRRYSIGLAEASDTASTTSGGGPGACNAKDDNACDAICGERSLLCVWGRRVLARGGHRAFSRPWSVQGVSRGAPDACWR